MPLALPTVILVEFFVFPPVIVVEVDGVGLLSEPSRNAADPDPDMLKTVKPGPAPRNVLYEGTTMVWLIENVPGASNTT
jgi:hypothetical protein